MASDHRRREREDDGGDEHQRASSSRSSHRPHDGHRSSRHHTHSSSSSSKRHEDERMRRSHRDKGESSERHPEEAPHSSRSSHLRDQEGDRERRHRNHKSGNGGDGQRDHPRDRHHHRPRSPERTKDRDLPKRKRDGGQEIIDDDNDGPRRPSTSEAHSADMAAAIVPSSDSLGLQSHPTSSTSTKPAPLPKHAPTRTQLKRDDWMLLPSEEAPVADLNSQAQKDSTNPGTDQAAPDDASMDFFSTLGEQRIKKPRAEKPDPEQLQISSRELNTQLVEGRALDEYDVQPKRKLQFGAPGYQWRMMKLRKTFEQAEEEGRDVLEVAIERYGDEDSFNEAQEERAFLDSKGGSDDASKPFGGSRKQPRPQRPSPGVLGGQNRSYMFTDSNSEGSQTPRSLSAASFRKPGEESMPSTPKSEASTPFARSGGLRGTSTAGSKAPTPIPSVFTPTLPRSPAPQAASAASASTAAESKRGREAQDAVVQDAINASQSSEIVSDPPMDAAALNKLEAKVMKAELAGKPNAASLRGKLEREKARASKGGDQGGGFFDGQGHNASRVRPENDAESGGKTPNIQVLPTLDGRGRLYDIGSTTSRASPSQPLPGNKRKKAEKVETHDPVTGEVIRLNADDDTLTLEDLVRQEKFKAGSADQKNYDAELASRIANDASYKDDFDYFDDNAEKLARKKMKSDALKRQSAINDFAKTKKALDSCRYCWRDEGDKPPHAKVVASGTRAYLALPEYEPLVDGHCLIVPIQHHLSMLEADDDVWEEVKNFMKCLLQLFSQSDHSLVFYETVISLKSQRHTVIEAVPLPRSLCTSLPTTFQIELNSIGSDWSHHKKVIPFTSEKPFRRSMVPHLPYFVVQFDHKGEKGYGHVIEEGPSGNTSATGGFNVNDGDDFSGMTSTSDGKNSNFERWFAQEIIGSLLDLEPSAWRRPRRLGREQEERNLDKWKKRWEPFDWTKLLKEQKATKRAEE